MPVDIRAERQRRASLAKQARELLDGAQEARRDLTAEESETFDRLMSEADGIDARIEREERVERHERRNEEIDPDAHADRNGPDQGRASGDRSAGPQIEAFRAYLRGGLGALSPEQQRQLQASNDPEGGFLVAPEQFVTDLIQEVDDQVPLRGLARVEQVVQAESLGAAALEEDLDDAEWTHEVGTGSQDDSLRFSKRELHPQPLAKRVRVSRKLLRLTAGRAEVIVRQRMSYRFATAQENAFMTGDGNKKPLGLFVASTMGISTNRDVDSGSDTGFTADGLVDAKYALKAAYWPRARWLFHRDAIREIRKLRTGGAENQFIWQPGLASDRPDTILDTPYVISEFAPNTFTQGQYGGMIGDFSHYWIADALSMEIQRLVELYAESNQVGFIGRLETDAMPVLEEPFVRVQIGE